MPVRGRPGGRSPEQDRGDTPGGYGRSAGGGRRAGRGRQGGEGGLDPGGVGRDQVPVTGQGLAVAGSRLDQVPAGAGQVADEFEDAGLPMAGPSRAEFGERLRVAAVGLLVGAERDVRLAEEGERPRGLVGRGDGGQDPVGSMTTGTASAGRPATSSTSPSANRASAVPRA